MQRFSILHALLAMAAAAVLLTVFVGLYNLQNHARYAEDVAWQANRKADALTAEVDRLRSAVSDQPPSLRHTAGRKAAQVDRDGWPARSLTLHQDKFGGDWPFRATQVRVTGTLFGVCLVEVDEQLYALNSLAEAAGYQPAGVVILKHDPSPQSGDLMDVGPVRDVALRLCQQLREEHLQQPYQLP